MAVYDPSGSNNVHVGKTISGKKATNPKTNPAKVAKKAAKATKKKEY